MYKKVSCILSLSITLLNPTLFCNEDVIAAPLKNQPLFSEMTNDDQQTTGINKLSDEEKNSLAKWIKEKSLACSQNTPAESPKSPSNTDDSSNKEAILSGEEADTLIMDLEESQEDEKPQAVTYSVKAIREDGKFVDLDNSTSYKVPSLLNRKTAKWQNGQAIEIQPTKKPQWVRLVNSSTHESVLAKIEVQENQGGEQNSTQPQK